MTKLSLWVLWWKYHLFILSRIFTKHVLQPAALQNSLHHCSVFVYVSMCLWFDSGLVSSHVVLLVDFIACFETVYLNLCVFCASQMIFSVSSFPVITGPFCCHCQFWFFDSCYLHGFDLSCPLISCLYVSWPVLLFWLKHISGFRLFAFRNKLEAYLHLHPFSISLSDTYKTYNSDQGSLLKTDFPNQCFFFKWKIV